MREQRIVLASLSGLIAAAALFAASGRPVLLAGLAIVACLSLFSFWFNGSHLQRQVQALAKSHKGKIGGALFVVFVSLVATIAIVRGTGS